MCVPQELRDIRKHRDILSAFKCIWMIPYQLRLKLEIQLTLYHQILYFEVRSTQV